MKFFKRSAERDVLESLQREVTFEADRLSGFIHHIHTRTSDVETQLHRYVNTLDAEGSRHLVLVRRVTEALNRRLDRITRLLQIRTEDALSQAKAIASADLVIPNDAVHALITDQQIAPIPIENLDAALEKLLSKVVIRPDQVGQN